MSDDKLSFLGKKFGPDFNDEGWMPLPTIFLKSKRQLRLTAIQSLVLDYMLSWVKGGETVVYPSMNQIAEELGCSKGSVCEAIDALEKSGCIKLVEVGKQGRSARYDTAPFLNIARNGLKGVWPTRIPSKKEKNLLRGKRTVQKAPTPEVPVDREKLDKLQEKLGNLMQRDLKPIRDDVSGGRGYEAWRALCNWMGTPEFAALTNKPPAQVDALLEARVRASVEELQPFVVAKSKSSAESHVL